MSIENLEKTVVGLKPRPALREPAFRRFEGVMRAAIQGPLELGAAQLDGRTARSWIVAFNEARLGALTHGYQTDLDPVAMARLQAQETADGGVYVHLRVRGQDRIKATVAQALGEASQVQPVSTPKGNLQWPAQRVRVEELLVQIKEDPGFLARHGEITIHTSTEAELVDVELYCANAGVLYPLVDSKRRLVIVPVVDP